MFLLSLFTWDQALIHLPRVKCGTILNMPTYYIHTFDCQANKSDSSIAGDYEARGYTIAKSWKTADEIIVNTVPFVNVPNIARSFI